MLRRQGIIETCHDRGCRWLQQSSRHFHWIHPGRDRLARIPHRLSRSGFPAADRAWRWARPWPSVGNECQRRKGGDHISAWILRSPCSRRQFIEIAFVYNNLRLTRQDKNGSIDALEFNVGAGLTIPPAVTIAVVALLTLMLAIALEAVREWLTNHDAKEDDICSTNNYRNTSMNKETINSNTLSTRFKKQPLCKALGVGFKVLYDTTIAVGASALLTLHRSTRSEPCSPLADKKSPGWSRAFSLERGSWPWLAQS